MAEPWNGIRISIDADPKYLDALRAVLGESTSILGLGEDETAKIALAVTEACARSINEQALDRASADV